MARIRFADTSFWAALVAPRDQNHATAKAFVRAGIGRVCVTNHVLGETWTLLCHRGGHHIAVEFLDRIALLPNVQVVHVDDATEQEAWRWLRKHDERKYSFVDATSFAVMRQREIREVLAFDSDFSAAGFVEARP